MEFKAVFFFVTLTISVALVKGAAKPALQHYNVDPATLTVSGISSGGAMATQFHFAHSANVTGAGIFAGGPYCCATPGLLTAALCMTTPALVKLDRLIAQTDKYAQNWQIDDTANLAHTRAYIFHGKLDPVVDPGIGRMIADMYQHYGVQLKTEFNIAATHGFPTLNTGAPCWQLSPLNDFLNRCDYFGAFEMLNFVYGGNLTVPIGGEAKRENILDYDQTEFMTSTPLLSTIANNAHLYVPTACRDGTTVCRLHVGFHGCMASQTFLGYDYLTKTGQADVAEVNNIIMLMPQVKSTLTNPPGCWDWYGYTNAQYSTKQGPQIRAVFKMVDRVINGV